MKRNEYVADRFRKLLINAKWKAGDQLPPEPVLASAFRVGRNAIREAVAQLVSERLLEIKPGIGTIARDWLSNAGLDAFSMVLELKRGTPRGQVLLRQLLWLRRGLYRQLAEVVITREPDLVLIENTVHEIRNARHGPFYWNDLPALLASEEDVLTCVASASGNLPATLVAWSIARILRDLLPWKQPAVELADAIDRFLELVTVIGRKDLAALTALLDELCRLREQTYLDLLNKPTDSTQPHPPPP